ncbi:MAG: GntR family transcriptional regulator, partial [Anaerolineae bacterium]|nr:GntR family transcriptional regulator [Anaerolineae bacterium]
MYKIDRVDPAPLYEQIRQILIREIRSGRYSEGDRLPTA